MLTLSAILAIVITVLAALHITYTITINSIIPKVSGAKAKANKQATINQAVLEILKNNGTDINKLTTK